MHITTSLAMVGSESGPGLLLHYRVLGELTQLKLPAPASPSLADGLWQHTCFEAFVGRRGDDAYREFNFSPSGQWAAYPFTARRQRDPCVLHAPATPWTDMRTGDGLLLLQAWVPCAYLPQGPWQLGLSAVLEHMDGRLAYWAIKHPGAQPDFHNPAGWTDCPDLPFATPSANHS